MAVTDLQIAYELALVYGGQGPDAASNEGGRITRLREVAEVMVDEKLGSSTTAPEAIVDECVIRLASYIWNERDGIGERKLLPAAWLYSGCGALTAPYIPTRAGALE